MDQLVWLRVAAVLTLCALLVVASRWIPVTALSPDEISAWTEPHRHAWYALPIVMLAFIALGLVPVLLLIALTGIAFGPVLGPIYAMAGCLASASIGFGIGRWLAGAHGTSDAAITGQLPSARGASLPSQPSPVDPFPPEWPSCRQTFALLCKWMKSVIRRHAAT